MTQHGERVHGNWRNQFGFRFMSSEDLEEGQTVTLTISGCTKEEAVNPKNKETKTLVALHFEETERLLALNVTNAKAIQHLIGTPKVDRWAGAQITVYRDTVKAFGETVPCLRVRRAAPKRGIDAMQEQAADPDADQEAPAA